MSLLSKSLGSVLVAGVLVLGGSAFTALQTATVNAQGDTPAEETAPAGDATAAAEVPAAMAEADAVRGKKVYLTVGRCNNCHGWGGDGTGSDPRSPGKAANLRITQLDAQTLHDVIACGTPGTEMPYHVSAAYKDPEICYGMLAADLGDSMPHKGKTFRDKDVWNVVAFIEQWYIPKGDTKVSLAECEEFFEGPNKACTGLK